MSNLENINDKLPAAGPENKPVRRSSRLQEKSEQKGQVDYLPTVSHPDQTEALDVGSPTSVAHTVQKKPLKIILVLFIVLNKLRSN